MSSNLVAAEDKPTESLIIDLNLQNTKMIIDCSYNPYQAETKKAFDSIKKFFGFLPFEIQENFNSR